MSNEVQNIAELLPEGLTEATLNEIAELVNTVINDQVEEKSRVLEAKVQAFLRMKIDEIKEQAKKELELEDSTFKNARIFEAIKTLMAMEISGEDQENAVACVSQDNTNLQEELQVVTSELNKALKVNEKYEKVLGALERKVDRLEESKESLQTEMVRLEENKKKPFKSSEKAIVVSEELGTLEKTQDTTSNNEFLTEDVMAFMPFNK
jgi:predicted HNH restriction endonuclease